MNKKNKKIVFKKYSCIVFVPEERCHCQRMRALHKCGGCVPWDVRHGCGCEGSASTRSARVRQLQIEQKPD